MRIRLFGADEIRRSLSMAEAIEVVKEAFVQLSLGKAQSPVRTSLDLRERGEVALIMPSYLERTRALGAKVVTVFPKNPEGGRPAVQALVVLFDAQTGAPAALLEGTELTRLRTGAAAGAATQVLSRPDCRTLALFGAGGQAFYQVQGVLSARKLERISIFDPLPERVEELIRTLRKSPARRLTISAAASPREALRGADIVVTVTTSSRPVFSGQDLPEGAHINAMGSFQPTMQEVDEETILRSRLFVDCRSACLEEAGDLLIPLREGRIFPSAIVGELGEVIVGLKPGRQGEREITYFKSVGNAVQDMAVAREILNRAEANSLGREVEL
ncbi:MAG: ornithine cyclodeaminase family protein [Deltaproteobacteria bacterium]|nr:ornithine cyclodeaminase family protein [Deltaproteobacteria bacterium]